MSRLPRWLLMASHVPPSGLGGGIVRYTMELAYALRRRDDVDLHLLATAEAAGPLGDLLGNRGSVVRLPALPDASVPAFERWALGRLLRDRFDVVQGTKHLVPVGVRARTALTVHDMLLLERAQDFGLAKRTLLARPYSASIRQADTLLCVSAATRDRVRHWEPGSVDRAAVVPLATSPTLLHAEPRPVAELAGRPFALVVGDSQPRKNLPVVTAAFQRVIRDRPDAVLLHVGPPAWGRESYGAAHAELTASGNLVQLVGVDDGTLRWCYEQAAVVLAPSLAEGFGLPAAEALDLGAPLVTSVDPALLEVSGDSAEHLPFDDVAGWAAAVLRHLAGDPGPTPAARATRSWDDVAAETVHAVLGPERSRDTGARR